MIGSGNMKYLLLVLYLFQLGFAANSQSEADKLRARQRQLQKKIKYTKQLIGDTKNKERLTMAELGIINQQIAHRDELVNLYAKQLKGIESTINANKDSIALLENDIVELKAKYAKMIYFAYKNRQSTQSSLLLEWISGEDFNKAYLRVKYLNQIAEYRKLQVDFIRKTQETLKQKQLELESDIQKKSEVIETKSGEKKQYQEDKAKQRELLLALKQEEGKLKNQLDDQQAKKDKLSKAIRKAIEQEIAAQSKKSNKGFGNTPEAKLLGKSFASNKGRLPWPVLKGTITGRFGKQPHPVIRGIYTQNNGVDISTGSKAAVRAVYSGKVTSVFVIPGAGRAVMISHGNYRTVYANLGDVYIAKGDQVGSKQEIGTLLTTENGSVSQAHFEIWKITNGNMEKQNPAYWLSH